MKGLLLKDAYILWKNAKSTLLICAVFLVSGFFSDDVSFYTIFPCLILGMMPITLLSYDENDRWSAYAAALPLSRATVVKARYLMGLLLGALAAALCTAVIVLSAPEAGGVEWADGAALASEAAAKGSLASAPMLTLGLLLAASLLPTALLLPFAYKWSVAKARVAYLILIGAMVGVASALVMNAGPDSISTSASGFDWSPFGAGALLALVTLGLYALSCGVSIGIYRRRDL